MNKRKNDSKNVNQESKRSRKATKRFGKRESTHTYDTFFDEADSFRQRSISFDQVVSQRETHGNSAGREHPEMTENEITSTILAMSATIQMLLDQHTMMTEEIRRIKSTSSLEFDINDIKEEDIPLLHKTKEFSLPIAERESLEKLNSELQSDPAFKEFFVRFLEHTTLPLFCNPYLSLFLQIFHILPIVRNMFQSRKQILWGFLTSTISTELLAQYTWTGKSETGNRMRFKDLSHVQIVLFNAMIKVDCNYTLAQFEDDIKINLIKCSNMFKYLQQSKDETTTIINQAEPPVNQSNRTDEQLVNQAAELPSNSKIIIQTVTTPEATESI